MKNYELLHEGKSLRTTLFLLRLNFHPLQDEALTQEGSQKLTLERDERIRICNCTDLNSVEGFSSQKGVVLQNSHF